MFTIAALYRFTRFDDPTALRPGILALCEAHEITGTLLLAQEGINGTIAGSRVGIDATLAGLRALPGCRELDHKESTATDQPFRRLKVRVKKEIVTLRQPGVDPAAQVGTYVEPANWNALIDAPDVVTIDTRNDYEVAIGSFSGALDPQTTSFSEFPDWWAANQAQFEGKRVAMFCTGGIRCEKASSFLLGEGVKEVFHLKGGILKYLEEVPADQSRWDGACFVFDQRVSVHHGLEEGEHTLCFACRRPLAPSDLHRDEYEPGVSCHICLSEFTDTDRERFRMRQRQMSAAASRGEAHLLGTHNKGEP